MVTQRTANPCTQFSSRRGLQTFKLMPACVGAASSWRGRLLRRATKRVVTHLVCRRRGWFSPAGAKIVVAVDGPKYAPCRKNRDAPDSRKGNQHLTSPASAGSFAFAGRAPRRPLLCRAPFPARSLSRASSSRPASRPPAGALSLSPWRTVNSCTRCCSRKPGNRCRRSRPCAQQPCACCGLADGPYWSGRDNVRQRAHAPRELIGKYDLNEDFGRAARRRKSRLSCPPVQDSGLKPTRGRVYSGERGRVKAAPSHSESATDDPPTRLGVRAQCLRLGPHHLEFLDNFSGRARCSARTRYTGSPFTPTCR